MTALLALALFASDVRAATVPQLRPGFTVSEADYPPSALRAGAAGVVGFAVTVDPEGAPAHCVVTTPLSPALDEKTCAIVIARMRFDPARNAAGRAVTATYTSHIRWNIDASPDPLGALDPRVDLTVTFTTPIDADGRLGKCTVGVVGAAPTPLSACPPASAVGAILPFLLGGPVTGFNRLRYVVVTRAAEPIDPPDGGIDKVAIAARIRVRFSADGKITACTPIGGTIPYGLPMNLCDPMLNRPAAIVTPGPAGDRAIGLFVLATPRPGAGGAVDAAPPPRP